MDEECEAKCWALKILVNRLRSLEDVETAKQVAGPVYKLVNALIAREGELSKKNDTPKHHKSRLRLLAATSMLKLCSTKMFDDILTHVEFGRLACVAQDPSSNVRRGFHRETSEVFSQEQALESFLYYYIPDCIRAERGI